MQNCMNLSSEFEVKKNIYKNKFNDLTEEQKGKEIQSVVFEVETYLSILDHKKSSKYLLEIASSYAKLEAIGELINEQIN